MCTLEVGKTIYNCNIFNNWESNIGPDKLSLLNTYTACGTTVTWPSISICFLFEKKKQ